jgi:hypothetical protein
VPDALKALVRTGVVEVPPDPAALIVMISVADVEVPPALEAFTWTCGFPAETGVPEIRPVLLRESPAGSPSALKPVGELVAVIWKLNEVPAVPDAVKALVREGVAATPSGPDPAMVRMRVADVEVPAELTAST